MSGTKTNRTDLENRFKKGMYPTENDFANVFASYVHKDDAITLSQITLEEGGDNLGEVIDSKADKQTLETFVREVETVLETTRDSETGAITNSAISSLAQRITDAENDIASAANAAETNGDSIAKILTILGKQNGESVSELASRFSALSGDYATVFAFVSKVKTFLESADVADTTINRWQEIEAFLQGITDTETLTGLLQQMKQEILAEIPSPQSGNFIEYTTDLDAITDAPNGKIMQYWGQSNDKYKRGQFYERVEQSLPADQFVITLNGQLESTPKVSIQDRNFIKCSDTIAGFRYSGKNIISKNAKPTIGDFVFIRGDGLHYITNIQGADSSTPLLSLDSGEQLYSSQAYSSVNYSAYKNTENLLIVPFYIYNETSYMNNPQVEEDVVMLVKNDNYYYVKPDSMRIGSSNGLNFTSWQHIHVDEVID